MKTFQYNKAVYSGMSQFFLSHILIEFFCTELDDLLTLMVCNLNSSYLHSLKRSLLRECHVMR